MNGNRATISESNAKQETKKPEKGFNLRVKECREDIAASINKANLPASVLLMIIGQFTSQLQALDAQAVAAESKAFEEGEKKDGKAIQQN